jgi:hypothetical protein
MEPVVSNDKTMSSSLTVVAFAANEGTAADTEAKTGSSAGWGSSLLACANAGTGAGAGGVISTSESVVDATKGNEGNGNEDNAAVVRVERRTMGGTGAVECILCLRVYLKHLIFLEKNSSNPFPISDLPLTV